MDAQCSGARYKDFIIGTPCTKIRAQLSSVPNRWELKLVQILLNFPEIFPSPMSGRKVSPSSVANEAAISLGRGGSCDLWIIIKINPVIIGTRDNPICNDLIPSCFQPGGRCELWYAPLSHWERFFFAFSQICWGPLHQSLAECLLSLSNWV